MDKSQRTWKRDLPHVLNDLFKKMTKIMTESRDFKKKREENECCEEIDVQD